uniref:J domain-containing protein n=1 Tax=Aureoumbra lagunensis TaxID=44058 RepID=A0A7S3JT24_9STRA
MAASEQREGRKNRSTLGLASRFALDADRTDEKGRKALHRFVGGTEGVAPEHLKRVLSANPQAASSLDKDGWLPINHYCRGLSGDLAPELAEDDVERYLNSLHQQEDDNTWSSGSGQKKNSTAGEDTLKKRFFQEAKSMAEVRKEYKKLSRLYHPDKNIGQEEEAAQLMHMVQEAYLEACEKFYVAHPIEAAAKSGDASRFINALRTEEEVCNGGKSSQEFVDAKGNNIVHLACQYLTKNLQAAELCTIIQLSGGRAKLFEQNAEGDLPLHVLLNCYRNPAELEFLIDTLLTIAGDDNCDTTNEQIEERSSFQENDRTICSTTNADGRLPIHIACRCQRFLAQKRCINALRRLVQAYPDGILCKDAYDWTPLHLFAQFQLDPTVAALEILLAGHTNVVAWTTCVDRDTPAHLACYANRRRIAESSIALFATLAQFAPEAAVSSCREHRNSWDHLPRKDLRYSRACAALLEPWLISADVQALSSWRDKKNNATLLHLLCSQEGASLPSSVVERVVSELLDSQEFTTDKHLNTPLHKICLSTETQHHQILFKLLKPHLLKDAHGRTPLHAACILAAQQQVSERIAWLLQAEPNAAALPTNDDEYPVHLACAGCSDEIKPELILVLKQLAQSAPSVAANRDGLGKFAWDYLPRHDERYEECLQLLLGQLLVGIEEKSLTKSHKNNELVLHLVCANHSSWVLKALKARPSEAYEVDSAGNSALHLFAQQQRLHQVNEEALDTLYALLKANEDAIMLQNKAGYTPLHLLCLHQKPSPASDVLTALLAARPRAAAIRCYKGDTAISCLCRANSEIIHPSLPANLRLLLDAANFEQLPIINEKKENTLSSIKSKLKRQVYIHDLSLLEPCDRGLRPWEHLPVSDDDIYAESCFILLHDLIFTEVESINEDDLKTLDRQYSTALHILCSRAGRRIRSLWLPSLQNQAKFLNCVDKNGSTPLHLACQYFVLVVDNDDAVEHEFKILEELIELSDSLLIQNTGGWTPLHLFVQKHAQYLCFDDEIPKRYDAQSINIKNELWRLFRAMLRKEPRAISLATNGGDTVLHLVCHACRKSIGTHCAAVLTEFANAAPMTEFATAARHKGKGRRLPIDWLPTSDPLYDECDEILTNRASRCLELLLEQHAPGASHSLPGSGEMALHQLCTVTPPVATVAMLNALLKAHPEAAGTPRVVDAATPLHLLCSALINSELSPAQTKSAPQLIQCLLSAAPNAAHNRDSNGNTPSQILTNSHSLIHHELLDECLAVFATSQAMSSKENIVVCTLEDTNDCKRKNEYYITPTQQHSKSSLSAPSDTFSSTPIVPPSPPLTKNVSIRSDQRESTTAEISWKPASCNIIVRLFLRVLRAFFG